MPPPFNASRACPNPAQLVTRCFYFGTLRWIRKLVRFLRIFRRNSQTIVQLYVWMTKMMTLVVIIRRNSQTAVPSYVCMTKVMALVVNYPSTIREICAKRKRLISMFGTVASVRDSFWGSDLVLLAIVKWFLQLNTESLLSPCLHQILFVWQSHSLHGYGESSMVEHGSYIWLSLLQSQSHRSDGEYCQPRGNYTCILDAERRIHSSPVPGIVCS